MGREPTREQRSGTGIGASLCVLIFEWLDIPAEILQYTFSRSKFFRFAGDNRFPLQKTTAALRIQSLQSGSREPEECLRQDFKPQGYQAFHLLDRELPVPWMASDL